MPSPSRAMPAAAIVMAALCASSAPAQDELMYDPENGIMIIQKKDAAKKAADTGSAPPQIPVVQSRDSMDLYLNRKKDPPTLYFMSGLEYFKNGDFRDALNNFRYADSVKPRPLYRLWVGKSYRKLNQPEKMIDVMMRIIEAYPQSDVADDALFEMAVHYQNSDEYQTATGLYKQLSEQYPFGVSYSTGEKYIDIARECRNKMHAEISNMLAILGYTHEDNAVNITSFQRNNHLKESGVADQKTVLAVKKMFQRILDREQKKARLDKEAERYLAWAGLAGAAGLCNIFVSIGILFQARARRRVLAELRANLAELDTRAL